MLGMSLDTPSAAALLQALGKTEGDNPQPGLNGIWTGRHERRAPNNSSESTKRGTTRRAPTVIGFGIQSVAEVEW